MFDTFEGFDERDVVYERKNGFSDAIVGQLNITSEDFVMDKMKYPEKCIIKKVFFLKQ